MLFRSKMRKLVAILGKDGLMHVVDRETHEQVYETPVTTRLNTEVETTVEGVRTCPGVLGGVLWNGPAFNPGTNMLYVPAVDWCVKGDCAVGLAMRNDVPTDSGNVIVGTFGKKSFGMRAPERESLAICVVMNPG